MPTNDTRAQMIARGPARSGRPNARLITQRCTFTVYSAADHELLGQVHASSCEAAFEAWQRKYGHAPVHIDEED